VVGEVVVVVGSLALVNVGVGEVKSTSIGMNEVCSGFRTNCVHD